MNNIVQVESVIIVGTTDYINLGEKNMLYK